MDTEVAKDNILTGLPGKLVNWNLAGRYGNAPWLSLWESCQPSRLTERVPQ